VILGLDVSTKFIGFCLLKKDGSFVDIGHVDLSKQNNLYSKLETFARWLNSINYQLTSVVVEAPLQRSNNQNVVNLLQRWNGMVCATIYGHLGLSPTLITQSTALKTLGVKIPKGTKGLDRKRYILQQVIDLNIVPECKWEYKKTGNPADWCYDQADAFIIASVGWSANKQKK